MSDLKVPNPVELKKVISRHFVSLNRDLSKYPHVKKRLQVGSLERIIQDEFDHQMLKAGIKAPTIKVFRKSPRLDKLHYEALGELKRKDDTEEFADELQRFTPKYKAWMKNVIAMFNKAKLLNGMKWLDTKKIIKPLLDLDISA